LQSLLQLSSNLVNITACCFQMWLSSLPCSNDFAVVVVVVVAVVVSLCYLSQSLAWSLLFVVVMVISGCCCEHSHCLSLSLWSSLWLSLSSSLSSSNAFLALFVIAVFK